MAHKITFTDVTSPDYSHPYIFTASTKREEPDMDEILDSVFFSLIRRQPRAGLFFYPEAIPSFEVDLSSVRPRLEPITRTSLIEEVDQSIVSEEALEYDIYVRMPPVKRSTVWVELKNVRKATPHIVEP